MSRRQPTRRPAAKSRARRAISGPTPAQLAAAMVEAVQGDLAHADPLQAQLVASFLVADRLEQYWEALANEDDRDDVARPAVGLIQLVRELRDPSLREPALALVLALASLDPEDDAVQDAAVEGVKRLRFLGAKPPVWAEHILEPDLMGVWCVRDVFSDALTIYVATQHEGFPAHCVAARIEQGRFPELVDVFVSDGPSVLLPEIRRALREDTEAELLVLEELSASRAAMILWDVVADAEETLAEALDDDAFERVALLEARAMLLDAVVSAAEEDGSPIEDGPDPHASLLDGLDATAIVDRFLLSDAYDSTDGTRRDVAEAIVGWVQEASPHGIARVSPNLVLEMLADLAQAAEHDEQRDLLIGHAIPTALAWVRWCATLVDLPVRGLRAVEQVLEAATADFEQLVRRGPDAASGALSDQVMELMLADGVDPGSQAELDDWSARWNALTDEQRVARMDALDRD